MKVEIEGNNGGDYLTVEPIGGNLLYLEVGHQCVIHIAHTVPVEFVTAVLAKAMSAHSDIEGAIQSIDWPENYVQKLISQVSRGRTNMPSPRQQKTEGKHE
jgi:hypothetical protein